MKVNEIFYSVQGEIDVGRPSTFVRLAGCNLLQRGDGCNFCDSRYAEAGQEMSLEEISHEVNQYDCKNVVITGGEPTMQRPNLAHLIEYLSDGDKHQVDIETNGTINDDNAFWLANNINCSPKRQAINLGILGKIKDYNSRFKFVYEDGNDRWWEPIIKNTNINKRRVYIMPEGTTKEVQESKMDEVVDYCKDTGYNFAPRLHVLLWGNRRGV